MVRIAEAFAKMELRQQVNRRDVDHAIAVMLESFCQTQKHATAHELRKKFGHYITAVLTSAINVDVDEEQTESIMKVVVTTCACRVRLRVVVVSVVDETNSAGAAHDRSKTTSRSSTGCCRDS